ncbi:MAG: UDP-N-acetylmuramate--L-alanine ligase [Coriobacteriia bacterium]|nr:UDP-N-acetylmuramate--L-alanine ligase [Coriobacteriia bacterium]
MAQDEIKRVHFIGIGGVGMSGIALVANDQGMEVSGSDLRASRYTDQLSEAGVTVHIGHDAANIPEGDDVVVVVSTAILDNNPEYREAQRRGLQIWHRAQMLARLGVGKRTLAVAGTHGKTTSSSMLASMLDAMGLEPSFLIGGMVRAYGTNAHSGAGDYYVVEADESDKSFTYLDPYVVMCTNIEADHLDHYSGLDEIRAKFAEFMGQVPEDGCLVVCGDEPELMEVAAGVDRRTVSYGFGEGCDVRVVAYEPVGVGSDFTLEFPDGSRVDGHVRQNPGVHNVLNAAGVIAVAWVLGLSAAEAADALAGFAGVSRRFDLVGEADGVTIVDDYAHHPTEIAATLKAAAGLDFKRVQVVFQPHRYSRVGLFTEVLRDDFAVAFDAADTLTFMDVYPAGEMPIPGVSGKTFLDVVLANENHPTAYYEPRRLELVPHLLERVEPGDLVVTMGAGDVTAVGPELLSALRTREQARKAEAGA